MCGIVGLATNFSNGFGYQESNAFQDMLIIDSMRGLDSTGVFGVDKNSNVEILKSTHHGLDFVMTPDFKAFRSELSLHGMFAVGHNRAATKGSVKDENAHPFWVDDKIILVQNGTVRGDHSKLAAGAKEVEVDSEAVAHMLSEEPDIAKALRTLDSAYALVWFNTETHTLYIIRNTERPMYYALGKNTGMIFASEETTLDYVIKKHNLPMNNVQCLEPHTLMSLTLNDNHYSFKKEKIDSDFRYVGGNHNSFRSRRHVNDDDGYGHWMGGWGGHIPDDEVIERTQPSRHRFHDINENPIVAAVRQAQPNKVRPRFDIDVQMDDYCTKHLTEYHVPAAEVGNLMKMAHESKGADGKFVVELENWIPANHNADCTSWHVYGKLLYNGDVKLPPVLIYWIIHGYSKAEVNEYVGKSFYSVDIHSFHAERFKKESAEMSVVRAYGTKAQPYLDDEIQTFVEQVVNASSTLLH